MRGVGQRAGVQQRLVRRDPRHVRERVHGKAVGPPPDHLLQRDGERAGRLVRQAVPGARLQVRVGGDARVDLERRFGVRRQAEARVQMREQIVQACGRVPGRRAVAQVQLRHRSTRVAVGPEARGDPVDRPLQAFEVRVGHVVAAGDDDLAGAVEAAVLAERQVQVERDRAGGTVAFLPVRGRDALRARLAFARSVPEGRRSPRQASHARLALGAACGIALRTTPKDPAGGAASPRRRPGRAGPGDGRRTGAPSAPRPSVPAEMWASRSSRP